MNQDQGPSKDPHRTVRQTLNTESAADEKRLAEDWPEAGDATRLLSTHGSGGQNDQDAPPPEQLGRYRVLRSLGTGGYGVVYLGYDAELNRKVALKAPRRDRLVSEADRGAFIHEARAAAQLRHPNIVAIFDIFTNDGLPIIVQEFIDGPDLAIWAAGRKLDPRDIAELFIALAAPLGHAHQRGFTHRDLKPSNILIDSQGGPHIADFGLAMHESTAQALKGQVAGTYVYMAPEQTRGETHRSDGRTDIWAVGVMLYRFLTDRMPFEAPNAHELFQEIRFNDPKPPRQIDANIPRELERICLKCLAKRRSERYNVAADVGEDLRAWLERSGVSSDQRSPPAAAAPTVVGGDTDSNRAESTRGLSILPKGLRAFDQHDADFFLDLLPGPRNRDGLPESVRFWLRHFEETNAEETFSVGLIYGPSGCGKSSLMKAGLLPRIAPHVDAIYVEATAEDTEGRLLRQLRRRHSQLPETLDLPSSLRYLRERSDGDPPKVLIVIDQFEQWLHSHHDLRNEPLTDALRQCDGGRVQAAVMVRDDFYLSVNCLFQELDTRLIEGRNYAVVDLFDQQHAAKVLAAFGRAYGKLPERLTPQHEALLRTATQQVAEGGKVVCVRLSLVADMLKNREWTSETLAQVGGVAGLGETFLEETFVARSAPPAHRAHQEGARGVLRALLPPAGTDIKGAMQSRTALQSSAGYQDRDRDFDELLAILDSDLRLITPTEPDGEVRSPRRPAQYYQLTHDYLVPSLRGWLTRKQRETARGRAELRLSDLASAWTKRQETRYFPSLVEHLQIRRWTNPAAWTAEQAAMMRRSGRYYSVRCAAAAAAVVLLGVLAYGAYVEAQATRLASNLLNSSVDRIGEIRQQIPGFAWRVNSKLLPEAEQTTDRHRALHAQLGLVASNDRFKPWLQESLLDDTLRLEYLQAIGDALRESNVDFTKDLWRVMRDESRAVSVRFRAALVLAKYAPAPQAELQWQDADVEFLVHQFLSSNPEYHPVIRGYLAPSRDVIRDSLARAFQAEDAPQAERVAAAVAVREFYAADLPYVVPLFLSGSGPQYAELFPLFNDSRHAIESFNQKLLESPEKTANAATRVALGQQRATAAITLLRKNEPFAEIISALQVTDDPEFLTQFIHRCRARGITAQSLMDVWRSLPTLEQRETMSADERKPHDGPLFAILLALGDFAWADIPSASKEDLTQRVTELHARDPSSAVHAASGWLLRHWELGDLADRVDATPRPYDESGRREWYVMELKPENDDPQSSLAVDSKTTYFTMIVFPAGEYRTGSEADEVGRRPGEVRRQVKLTRPVAVSDREVTWRHIEAYYGDGRRRSHESQFGWKLSDRHPVVGVSWLDAVAHCRRFTTQAGWDESEQCYADIDAPTTPEGYVDVPETTQWPADRDRAGFRLPTSAEWEYFCRAGTNTAYSFGGEYRLAEHYAWTLGNCESPRECGRLRPNLRGIFDLHGNVFEWTQDWYSPPLNTTEVTDPAGGDDGFLRVTRSGGWDSAAHFGRSANFSGTPPGTRYYNLGFRVVMRPGDAP